MEINSLFTHHNQPYGSVTFKVESAELVSEPQEPKSQMNECQHLRAKRQWRILKGVVIKGMEVSRVGWFSQTRDLAGMEYSIEVPPEAYQAGEYTTVAM